MCVHVQTHTHTQIHTHKHIHTYIRTNTQTHLPPYKHNLTRTYIQTYAYTQQDRAFRKPPTINDFFKKSTASAASPAPPKFNGNTSATSPQVPGISGSIGMCACMCICVCMCARARVCRGGRFLLTCSNFVAKHLYLKCQYRLRSMELQKRGVWDYILNEGVLLQKLSMLEESSPSTQMCTWWPQCCYGYTLFLAGTSYNWTH
jgi:hypothetical protein